MENLNYISCTDLNEKLYTKHRKADNIHQSASSLASNTDSLPFQGSKNCLLNPRKTSHQVSRFNNYSIKGSSSKKELYQLVYLNDLHTNRYGAIDHHGTAQDISSIACSKDILISSYSNACFGADYCDGKPKGHQLNLQKQSANVYCKRHRRFCLHTYGNISALAFALMCLYSGFISLKSLQSTVHPTWGGIGVTSLSCVYASGALSCLIAPSIIKLCGFKYVIIASMSLFLVYLGCNLLPESYLYLLFPAAILVGCSKGMIWIAASAFITLQSFNYSNVITQDRHTTLCKFNGLFFSIYSTSQIWSHLISTVIFATLSDKSTIATANTNGVSSMENGSIFTSTNPEMDYLNNTVIKSGLLSDLSLWGNKFNYSGSSLSTAHKQLVSHQQKSHGSSQAQIAQYYNEINPQSCGGLVDNLHNNNYRSVNSMIANNGNPADASSNSSNSIFEASEFRPLPFKTWLVLSIVYGCLVLFAMLIVLTIVKDRVVEVDCTNGVHSSVDNKSSSAGVNCRIKVCSSKHDAESQTSIELVESKSRSLGEIGGDGIAINRGPRQSCSSICNTLSLVKDPRFQLLVPLILFTAFKESFVFGDYTKHYVNCAIGIQGIGMTMICYGTMCTLGSLCIGLIVKHIKGYVIVVAASLFETGNMMVLLWWRPHVGDVEVFYVIASSMGLCDAIWKTQINVLIGTLFHETPEEAFSLHRMLFYTGLSLAFASSRFLLIKTKIYIMAVSLLVGLGLYAVVQIKGASKLHIDHPVPLRLVPMM